ncbi:hypothetical protein SBRCBS47491_008689 [Sporothrix bragantina]|uniref:C2H2-type domain-containing protein n=1 Tax=Sporothrix bragantina TaxID=671064 RepID=A0ABP0CNL0_9PEZI
MKGSKTARFASTVASTKLPQVVTTSHGDTDIDFMSSLQGISGQGSETSLSTTGHRRSTTHGRRSSGKGKDSAGTSSSHEGRRTKSHHSGRRGSGSTEGGSGTTWTKKEFVCQHQFCNSPAFTRMADLERHMKHIHMDADKKERFLCDYSECSRNSTPFHRKDHYREHLREYHLEDLLKRGSNAHRSTSPNTASATASAADYKKTKKLMQEMQLQNCKTDPSWWRCARCLKRVSISERGWTCPSCKGSIEEPRKDIRDLRASGTAGDYTAVSSNVEVTMSSLAAAPAWSHGNFAFEPYK